MKLPEWSCLNRPKGAQQSYVYVGVPGGSEPKKPPVLIEAFGPESVGLNPKRGSLAGMDPGRDKTECWVWKI